MKRERRRWHAQSYVQQRYQENVNKDIKKTSSRRLGMTQYAAMVESNVEMTTDTPPSLAGCYFLLFRIIIQASK